MSSQINRRDFLKLLPLLSIPLIQFKWPHLLEVSGDLAKDQTRPNILILLFDTLSAKHLSLYGYHRETTPHLARFADKALVFHSHYAGGNFTSPGTASLLTGVYPWSHRAIHLYGTVEPFFQHRNLFSSLPDDYYKVAYTHNLLVASLLHQFRGDIDLWKETGELCLSEGDFSDKLFPKDYNIAFQGESTFLEGDPFPSSKYFSWFHRFRQLMIERALTKDHSQLFPRGIPKQHTLFFLLEHVVDWIIEQIGIYPQPFLGYFHLLPPHAPYNTRQDFVDAFNDGWEPMAKQPHFFSEGHSDEQLNRQRREYDEYIAYVDAEFGRLIGFLEEHGFLDNTYVILTSDHGELFERGMLGHASPTLYEPLVKIPLVISKPHQQQREDVHALTSCVDLLPTLLHTTGKPVPSWCEGRILPTFGGQEPGSDHSIFAVEAKSNNKQAPLTTATLAIIKDRYKLVHYLGYEGYKDVFELYDLANDPEELENLFSTDQFTGLKLQQELEEKLRSVNHLYQQRS